MKVYCTYVLLHTQQDAFTQNKEKIIFHSMIQLLNKQFSSLFRTLLQNFSSQGIHCYDSSAVTVAGIYGIILRAHSNPEMRQMFRSPHLLCKYPAVNGRSKIALTHATPSLLGNQGNVFCLFKRPCRLEGRTTSQQATTEPSQFYSNLYPTCVPPYLLQRHSLDIQLNKETQWFMGNNFCNISIRLP
jgi:hypothetical protein